MKLVLIFLGAAALTVLAACSGSTKDVVGPTVTAHATVSVTATETETATVRVTEQPTIVKVIATKTRTETLTYHPSYTKYGEGTYVVGVDIKPGTYHTAGADICY